MASSPAAITDVIANRVRHLREQSRLSGAGLAERMVDAGIPWDRTTVAKLESGRRASLTVQELLGLAVALGVPPVWLLTDPATTAPAHVTDRISVEQWRMALWVGGSSALGNLIDEPWNELGEGGRALRAIDAAQMIERLLERLRGLWSTKTEPDGTWWIDLDSREAEDTVRERQTLQALATPLQMLREVGCRPPAVPDDVRRRAEQVGVQLPADDGED